MLRMLDDGYLVWQLENIAMGSICPSLATELKKWKQTSIFSKEAGGVLLGFIDSNTDGLLCETLTKPGKGDKRGRCNFFRGKRHQSEANDWHKATKGKGTQLGLWHTHPEPKPMPSSVDIEDFRNTIKTGLYCTKGILYIIVGTKYTGFWYGAKEVGLTLIGHFEI